jgi:hypothetical protein
MAWDEASRHHEAVVAGMKRCQCPGCAFCALRDDYGDLVKVRDPETGQMVLVPHRVRVPLPVHGVCLYCFMVDAPKGARTGLKPIREPRRSEPDDEGGLPC